MGRGREFCRVNSVIDDNEVLTAQFFFDEKNWQLLTGLRSTSDISNCRENFEEKFEKIPKKGKGWENVKKNSQFHLPVLPLVFTVYYSLSRLLINGLAIVRFRYREYLNYFDATWCNVRPLNILVLITLNIRLSRVTRLTCMPSYIAWHRFMLNSGQPAYSLYEYAIVCTRFPYTKEKH